MITHKTIEALSIAAGKAAANGAWDAIEATRTLASDEDDAATLAAAQAAALDAAWHAAKKAVVDALAPKGKRAV